MQDVTCNGISRDGQLRRSLEPTHRCPPVGPEDVWGYILLGNIYVKYKEDRKTGEQFYKKALELNPKDPYLLNNYAAVKAENGQTDESQAMFEKAIEIDPLYPNSYYGLATLLSKMNRKKEALSSLENSLFSQSLQTQEQLLSTIIPVIVQISE